MKNPDWENDVSLEEIRKQAGHRAWTPSSSSDCQTPMPPKAPGKYLCLWEAFPEPFTRQESLCCVHDSSVKSPDVRGSPTWAPVLALALEG